MDVSRFRVVVRCSWLIAGWLQGVVTVLCCLVLQSREQYIVLLLAFRVFRAAGAVFYLIL